MIGFRIASLIILVGAMAASESRAQLYRTLHRPGDVEYHQFETQHFRFIYQTGLYEEAAEMAAIFEESLPEVRALVGIRRPFHAPVVLNSFSDRANGFVTPLPFRHEIEAVNLRTNVLSPRFNSWFETVAPHELVHAVHAESGRGFGVGWLLRTMGPDLARALNLGGPRGINEGAAVWYESSMKPGAGRLRHSMFMMEFRAAMLSSRPPNLTQMLEPPAYTRPLDRYYHGGGHLFSFMADRGEQDFFPRTRDFYYRFPLLGFGPALWYGTRTFPATLGRRLRRHYVAESRAFVTSLGDLTEPQVIASERGATYRRPKWLDNSTVLVFARGYDWRPGFYRVDVSSGRRELVSTQAITEDFFYSLTPDRSAILFSRYVPDVFEPIRSTAEVFRLDLQSGGTRRLTTRGRAYAPVEDRDGTTWVLKNETQFNHLSRLEATGEVVPMYEWDRAAILAVEPSPRNSEMAILLNRGGHQGIYRFSPADAALLQTNDEDRTNPAPLQINDEHRPIEPWIVFEDASIYDVTWSADGRYLLFAADPGRVANIYAWDAEQERLLKITNVPFGALEPSLSPDGSTLIYAQYRHERYDLVRIPFEPDRATVIPRGRIAFHPPTEPTTGSTTTTEPVRYVGWKNVRPRVLYPFIVYQRPSEEEGDTELGFGFGAGLEWSDPLQYWIAQTGGYIQKGTIWGRILVQSGRPIVQPRAAIFRNPSTTTVRIISPGGTVDTVRVGREERGIGAGVQIPAVFRSNIFRTQAFASFSTEYRQERLFDNDRETLRDWADKLSLVPSGTLVYRSQSNGRDVVPNSGLVLAVVSKFDIWSNRGNPSRWLQARTTLHLPFLQRSNTGIVLSGSLLAQNEGGLVDPSGFFPRGYETESVFLGRGTFAKYGIELLQPLWYIDSGFFLFPLYFKALYAYGFAEAIGHLGGPDSIDPLASAGGGLGLQMRFAHSISLTVRFAPVYRFAEKDWDVTFR